MGKGWKGGPGVVFPSSLQCQGQTGRDRLEQIGPQNSWQGSGLCEGRWELLKG